MYQLDSALAFGDMTDDDISSAEKVAREELNELLEKQLGRELNNEEKSNFFGIYAGFPEKFSFLGNLKLIRQMIQHVQSKLQENPDSFELKEGLNNKKRNNLLKGTVQTSLGLIYGDRKMQNNTNSQVQLDITHDSITSHLFVAAKKLFETYEEGLIAEGGEILSPFTKEMIKINFNENDDIKAAVVCQFCCRENKVHLKRSGIGFSWILSNLKSHINTCLKIKSKLLNNSEDEYEKDSVVTEKTNKNKITKRKMIDNHQTKYGKKSLTMELVIEPVLNEVSSTENNDPLSDLENEICQQLTVQNIKMTNIVAKHKEIKKRCKINVNGIEFVDICVMNGDGNCAFSVIAHQMFKAKVNSPEHFQQTKKLRADVVH